MTEIKNEGKKLVHIGKIMLMPGDTVTVADTVADTPAIHALTNRGLLSVSTAKAAKAEAKTGTNAKKTAAKAAAASTETK